jgi:hypothetical protein
LGSRSFAENFGSGSSKKLLIWPDPNSDTQHWFFSSLVYVRNITNLYLLKGSGGFWNFFICWSGK